jgi:amino acid adenylation domain-containing protein
MGVRGDLVTNQTIHSLVRHLELTRPDEIALLGVGGAPSRFTDLFQQIEKTAGWLAALSVSSADKIATVVSDSPEMASLFLAVSSVATCAPLNPKFRNNDLELFLADLNPKLVIVDNDLESPVREVAHTAGIDVLELHRDVDGRAGSFHLQDVTELREPQYSDPDHVALVLQTSGTTSRPKIVPLTHTNLCFSAASIAESLQLSASDRCLNIMPLFHIHGLIGALLSSLSVGGSVVCTPGFQSIEFFRWLDRFHPTWYTGVPTMHQAIISRVDENSEIARRSTLRLIRSCSSALPPAVMAQLEEKFHVPVIEAYGMTEASHQMTSNPLPPLPRKPGSVGISAGPEITILNDQGDQLAPGQTGEIAVRGPNVTRGYEENPEANLKSFTNGWFRTGDQGHIDIDGYLWISGRIKELIVRGGEKISPREIDELLLTHRSVAQALAFAIPDSRLGEEVGAAVVVKPGNSISELELREFLVNRTVDFKVPRKIVFVDKLPTGPTGKPQRIGLASKLGVSSPYDAPCERAEFVAPRSSMETVVAKIWNSVLRREASSVYENFFDSGGDSILAVQFIARVRRRFGAELSVARFFANPTIEQVAGWLSGQKREPNTVGLTVKKAARTAGIPLSFPQKRMWFASQFAQDSPVYNRGFALQLKGPLDLFRMQQSISAVASRHDVLRTNYLTREGIPTQTVGELRPFTISLIDLTREPEAIRLSAAHDWARSELIRPFNLASDLMLRASLAKLSKDDHILLFVTHHIAFDATSQKPFLHDLSLAYEDRLSPLTGDRLDYPDFANWETTQDPEIWARSLDWWKRELAGIPNLHRLPCDFTRPIRQSYRGGTKRLFLDSALVARVAELAKKENATPFVVLLSGFHALVHRYSSSEEVVVGSPISGRSLPETEDMVGLFVNLLVLRTRGNSSTSFRKLISKVKETTLNALDHQDLPFEKLVEGLAPERSLSYSPLFQLMFEYRNQPSSSLEIEDISAEPFEFETGCSQYDLTLDVQPARDGMYCSLHYNTDLFKEGTAQQILENYRKVLTSALENPEQELQALNCQLPSTLHKASASNARSSSENAENSLGAVIPKRVSQEPSPLSFAQERLWFIHQLEPENAAYNIPLVLRLTGQMDVEALRRALEFVTHRHESLRTTFNAKEGIPVQVIQPPTRFELSVVDTSNIQEEEFSDAIQRILSRSFDLSRDLMLRAVLFEKSAEDHQLLIVVHHIAADGWSMPILQEEIGTAYSSFVASREPRLPELPLQYSDFANWQREFLRGPLLQRQLDFWTKQLKGAPNYPLLLTDRLRGPRQTYRGDRFTVTFDSELESMLNEFNRRERVTLFMTLLAGLETLLHRISGQNDIVVGAPIANRTRVELEPLIGFFVNTLALRCEFTGDPTFRDVLGKIRANTLEAYQNQDLPFEKLVQALQPERSLSHSPIFQVIFAVQNTPDENPAFQGLSVTQQDVDERVAKFDLSIFVEFKPKLRIGYNYNRDLFERETIVRFAKHFENLLKHAVESPDTRTSDLQFVAKDEAQRLLAWGRNPRPYPQTAVHEVFEQQVLKSPHVIAVVAGSEEVTYKELNERANQLARGLKQIGIRKRDRVGLLMRRSVETIASMLAILKAGAAYVPIDPDLPKQRIEFIADDCKLSAILTSEELKNRAPVRKKLLRIDELERGQAVEWKPQEASDPDQAAYVMYTSGSTGAPKGVEVPHRGIVRLVFSQDYADFASPQTTLQLAPISFDASTLEIWAALLRGGRCVLFTGSRVDAEQVGMAIRKHEISTLWLTSSLFNSIIEESPEALKPVRQLLTGGEALSVSHVRRAHKSMPNTQLINGYGPTENTTFSCCHRIDDESIEGHSSIPIGKPIANSEAYILDAHLRLAGIGVPGELCLGGDGLALGYVDRPELTVERFVNVQIDDGSNRRIYKTGDICRWLNSGIIEFMGRADEQVKIRGFRIELGEIDSTISAHPSVKSVATTVVGEGANKRLVSYVVAKDGRNATAAKLREFVRQSLPEYMVPAQYVFLAALPMSTNGKIDKAALPTPTAIIQEQEPTTPLDAVETKLKSIWENVLGVSPVGIDQDFFELGGHSLLATRLIARVERSFGIKLPIASIFQFPSVAEFAPRLRRELVDARQNYDSKPPLLWVGGGTFLRPIAKWLQPERSLISLSLDDGEWASLKSPYHLEDAACLLAKRILREYPNGPYYLGGWCYEGLLAYETAQQLQAQGAEVGLLAVVDAATPSSRKAFKFSGEIVARLQRELFHLRRLLKLPLSKWSAQIRERTDELSQRIQRSRWQKSYRSGDEVEPTSSSRADRILHLAIAGYVPQPYAGSLLFFQAAERPMGKYWDLAWEWKALAGDQCECREIPGDHVTLLKAPNIDILADYLKTSLDETERLISLQKTAGVSG